MDRISELENEIAELRKNLMEKENKLYELKKTMLSHSNPQLLPFKAEYQQCAVNSECAINSECARAEIGDKLSRWAIERYSRQILLSQIGVPGQVKLGSAKVLVVGAGGLGSPAAMYLAGAGVGEIGIVDYDTVDVTNIHRQILYREEDQFMTKVEAATNALRKMNSHITVTPYNLQLDSSTALQIISRYNLVLDCSDNVPTRYMLNDACVLLKVPLISGSALKMEGQLTIYNHKEGSRSGPCYRCLFESPPPPETVGSCSDNGVCGAVCGTIGTLQALEAIKLIVDTPYTRMLVGRMLIFDGEDMTFRIVKLRPKNPSCAACSDNPRITQLLDYEQFCKTRAKEKKKEAAKLASQRRKEEKEKRMTGQSYFGFRKSKSNEKEKWIQDVPKEPRKIGPPCKSEYCAKGIARHCNLFNEEKRQQIFCQFWLLGWPEKKKFVRSLVDSIPPKRRRLKHKGEVSRKGDSKLYHLFCDDQKVPVCRVMFLNTLGIKEAMVRCWLLNVPEISRGPKKKPIKSLSVDSWIDNLPKVPPKCIICRNSTIKQYVDCNVKNQYQLYNLYVKDMKQCGLNPASRKTFSKVFNSKDLNIFKPKNDSDVCDMISQHNTIVPSVDSYQNINLQSFENINMPQDLMTNITYSDAQW